MKRSNKKNCPMLRVRTGACLFCSGFSGFSACSFFFFFLLLILILLSFLCLISSILRKKEYRHKRFSRTAN